MMPDNIYTGNFSQWMLETSEYTDYYMINHGTFSTAFPLVAYILPDKVALKYTTYTQFGLGTIAISEQGEINTSLSNSDFVGINNGTCTTTRIYTGGDKDIVNNVIDTAGLGYSLSTGVSLTSYSSNFSISSVPLYSSKESALADIEHGVFDNAINVSAE